MYVLEQKIILYGNMLQRQTSIYSLRNKRTYHQQTMAVLKAEEVNFFIHIVCRRLIFGTYIFVIALLVVGNAVPSK
jgi:hypothetical protein